MATPYKSTANYNKHFFCDFRHASILKEQVFSDVRIIITAGALSRCGMNSITINQRAIIRNYAILQFACINPQTDPTLPSSTAADYHGRCMDYG